MGLLSKICSFFGGSATADDSATSAATAKEETKTTEQSGEKPMSSSDEGYKNNRVGPIVRAGDVANAAVDAAEVDNEGKELFIDDNLAYIRMAAEGEFILKRETMEEMLGRSFEMRELEINLSSFAGQIEMGRDQVRFFYEKTL